MNPGPPHKRRRPAVACTECRRRKVSCDLASPCGPCSKSRSGLNCVYNNDYDGSANGNGGSYGADRAGSKPSELPRARKAHPQRHKSLDSTASSNHHVPMHDSTIFHESMLNLDDIFLDAVTSSHTDSSDDIFDAISGFSHRELDPKLMTLSPFLTATSLPSSSTSNGMMKTGTQALLQPSIRSSSTTLAERLSSLEPSTNNVENKPHNFQIRPEGVRSLLRGVSDCTLNSHCQLSPGSESVQSLMGTLTKLERTAREVNENKVAFTTWPSKNPTLQTSSGREILPGRAQCDTLLDAYLKSFESVLRILHIPSFLQTYERFWGRDQSQWNDSDDVFVCTLLVVIALGSCVSFGLHDPSDSVRALQEQAMGWIAFSRDFLSKKIAMGAYENFEIAQLMCLLTLARHTQAQCGVSAGSRFMFGDDDLLRVGIRMRLYRDPGKNGAHGSTKDGEMHRRLWATMLELSLQSCLAEGLPAPIAPEAYNCEPPSNITDENIEGGSDDQCFTHTTILTLLAKTQRLRLRVLHLTNAPRTPQTSHEANRLGTELNNACNANMNALKAMQPSQPTRFQRKLLDVSTQSFVLALHNSFSDDELTDSASYYSRRRRMEISMLLLYPPTSQGISESVSLQNMQVSGPSAADTTPSHRMSTIHGNSVYVATDVSGNTTIPSLATIDAYISLLVHSNSSGHFVRIQRQMIASLCLDLISELEKNEFPILNQPSMQQIRSVLRAAMQTFEKRMRSAAGAHSVCEFVVFAAAAAYIDALLLGGATGTPIQTGSGQQHNVDETIARAVLSALNASTELLHRDTLS